MHITAICVTYGRVPWLEQSIACFLAQDYTGPRELLILNTFPRQTLALDAPNVRVINLTERPPSLGEARNLAIEQAAGTHIVTWDDDDLFLPGHLRSFADAFGDGQWVRMRQQFYMDGNEIKSITQGSCPVFAFTKAAWQTTGGYPKLGVGEDRAIVTRISTAFPGRQLDLRPDKITFCYRWGQGVHHMSGEGDDRPGIARAHDRFAIWVNQRADNGSIPTGNITLNPHLEHDYTALARAFVQRLVGQGKPECCIVQLGRYGDIINVLPVARHIAQCYGKPKWLVSREFISVFDGVSYVDPVEFSGQYNEIHAAIALAKSQFKNVLVTQVWGKDYTVPRFCKSYNRESWRLAGFATKFDEPAWRLVFDRRDVAREEALRNKLFGGKSPLLVNVTKSTSSPFSRGTELLDQIKSDLPVIDLAPLKAQRIYDLLGLMDVAAGLVSVDTALLHLAAACDVNVLALVNDQPWLGTELRCSGEVGRIPYCEVDLPKIKAALEQPKRAPYPPASPMRTPPVRYIYHAVEKHEPVNRVEAKRSQRARDSWDALYKTGVLPVHYAAYSRDARSIGDSRPLPYLRDVLQHGMAIAQPDDIIMFTNDDTYLHPDLPEVLRFHVSLYDAVSAQRCEFLAIPENLTADEYARSQKPFLGRDLFAFTKSWLQSVWDDLPDFILGAPEWDLCVASMIRLHHGIVSSRYNLQETLHPADLPRGYVLHTSHVGYWTQQGVMNVAPSHKHNRHLFREWAQKHQLPFQTLI